MEKFDRDAPSFPSGWRVKVTFRKGQQAGKEIREFLSPEFKVFRSKVAVVEYMRAMGGYTDTEIHKVLPVTVKREGG